MFSAFRIDVKGNRHPLLSTYVRGKILRTRIAEVICIRQKILPPLAGVDNVWSVTSLLCRQLPCLLLLSSRSIFRAFANPRHYGTTALRHYGTEYFNQFIEFR